MSLLDIVRSAVRIADGVTRSLQPEVKYESYKSEDGYGAYQYESPAMLRAIVELKLTSTKNMQGDIVVSRATVMFLDAAALTAASGGRGVTTDDRITLPDGMVGAVVNTGGFIDAGTGIPVATQAYLG